MLSHFQDLVGVNDNREIKIYLKVDYIQTLLVNEIRREKDLDRSKSDSIDEKSAEKASLDKILPFPLYEKLRSQSCNLAKNFLPDTPNLGSSNNAPILNNVKHLDLNKIFNGYSSSSLNRDLKEPEIYQPQNYKHKRRCMSINGNYPF